MTNSEKIKNKKQEIIVKQLYHTLTYESATIVAFTGYGIIGYTILLASLGCIAIFYSIYLIKTLYILKKTPWLVTFAIMVGTPLLLKLMFSSNIIAVTIFPSISLFMFYLFCWTLKFSVSRWLEDIEYADVNFDE